jgi:predicted transposase/invertase (TIGR01784 family)
LPDKDDKTGVYGWLRFLKAETREEFEMIAQANPTMNRAVAVLKELSADERTRMLNESLEKARRDEASRMKGARRDGIAEGKAEIVRNALRKNWAVSDISELTGFSREEIEVLR